MTSASTFPDLIRRAKDRFADRVFLPRRRPSGGDSVTFGQLGRDVEQVAAGLLSLGIQRGDHVGLISENCYEWLLADLACASVGITDVPRGTDTSPLELLFILRHAGCRLAFAENDQAARTLFELQDELPELRMICVLAETTTLDDVLTLADLRRTGRKTLAHDRDYVARASRDVTPDDILTIVYTSGTTAEPKGVMLSHANVLSNLDGLSRMLSFGEEDVFLSVLPAWHAYERVLDYVAFHGGCQLVYTDRRRIKEDLRAVRPTVFGAVPRIWESIHDGIVTACRRKSRPVAWFLDRVLCACRSVGERRANGREKLLHRLAQRKILPQFRDAAGGRLRIAVSGGGSLPRHVDACLLGIGIPVLNGYGLTETSPVVSVRTPEDNRPGTIGRPIPATEVEVRDEDGAALPIGQIGHLWIRGPQIMRGYYNNPERTERVLRDGWFHSGDLGRIEPDGHIAITGRAKDTIVLAGGENVEPEHIEAALKTSPLIEQAIVLGQDRKSLGAIVFPSLDCLELEVPREQWDVRDGVLEGEPVRRLYRSVIDRVLASENGFRPLERVATFRIVLEPMTIENGLLTQTLKMKRHVVAERHGELIAGMFG
ncbi:MAG: AMP-binding protein [Planctomycetes bacterium]|nr:AMP-binding protein [Planctomycetota bacterium]